MQAEPARVRRLQPYTYVPQTTVGSDNGCACSLLQGTVGENGVRMYALFPPPARDATSVDVLIPGLPTAKKIPVTR